MRYFALFYFILAISCSVPSTQESIETNAETFPDTIEPTIDEFSFDIYGTSPYLRNLNDRSCIFSVLRVTHDSIFVDTCYSYELQHTDALNNVGKDSFNRDLVYALHEFPYIEYMYKDKLKQFETIFDPLKFPEYCQPGKMFIVNREGNVDWINIVIYDFGSCNSPIIQSNFDSLVSIFEKIGPIR